MHNGTFPAPPTYSGDMVEGCPSYKYPGSSSNSCQKVGTFTVDTGKDPTKGEKYCTITLCDGITTLTNLDENVHCYMSSTDPRKVSVKGKTTNILGSPGLYEKYSSKCTTGSCYFVVHMKLSVGCDKVC